MTIAALYVDPCGIYAAKLGTAACWDAVKDARTYRGDAAVVAHPPCERWSRLAHIHGRIGEDGGCFAAALVDVERCGGVLEHPANSIAWSAFGLPVPPAAGGWVRGLHRRGWACHVEQGHYGHPAPKATWLYYVGPPPPPLVWGPSGATGRIQSMSSTDPRRRMTPPAFADVLIVLAKGAL